MPQIQTYESLGRFIIHQVYDIMERQHGSADYSDLKRQIGERIQNDPRCNNSFVMHEYKHTASYVFNAPLYQYWHMGRPNTHRWGAVMDFYISRQAAVFFLQHTFNYRIKEPFDRICYIDFTTDRHLAKTNGKYSDMVKLAKAYYDKEREFEGYMAICAKMKRAYGYK